MRPLARGLARGSDGATLRYIESAITLRFDPDKCDSCGMCTKVCPHAVFARVGNRVALADRGACMGCGACAKNCPHGAIQVTAGVGCAAAVLNGLLAGTEPACGACDSTAP